MNQKTTRPLLWLALAVVVVGAFVWGFVPVWTITPNKAQTPGGI